MAKAKSAVAAPDAAVIGALASNPAALAAYMAGFTAVPVAPAAVAKTSPVTPEQALAMFNAATKTCEVRTSVKGKLYAVIKYQHVSGNSGAATFWLG